jgi:polyphosphate kinase
MKTTKKNKYISNKNFINRELSWLEFNNRVLEEAFDITNPLFERLKFTSIVSSNLDEFFMIRVASISDQIMADFTEEDITGYTPEQQFSKISEMAHELVKNQYNCFNRSIILALKKENILLTKPKDLNQKQKKFIDDYFKKNIYPVITPMVVDQSRPFPLILNKSQNICLLLEAEDSAMEAIFGTVQVPNVLDRLIELPMEKNCKSFITLEDVIKMNIQTLFDGHKVLSLACYRITRNADQGLDEEGAEDLLLAIEQFIKKRKWGSVIRLEIEEGIDPLLFKILSDMIEVRKEMIFEIKGPIDLTFLMKMSGMIGYDHLRYNLCKPQNSPEFMGEDDIFERISQKDILVHHPFESFDNVTELVKKAASDPKVLAIKQTLYRVSGKSPIVEALAQAAENGKQVTVLVELKARFDEQNNIIWAKRLEMSGCHVIYGLVGLKTHCKILLIVRMEEDGIKRYVHMSTGNYNDVTAKLYTDLGLFTSNPYFGADASALFNMLSGLSRLTNMYKIDIAPINLREKFLKLINKETKNKLETGKGKIVAKLNSLVDEGIIYALYEASCAGVEIDLIVRGICCLRPGIPGVSDNIKVRSIVGRYLEHSRIYYFYNNGEELIYLSSADWMGRNLDRRVETMFPIEDKEIKTKVKDILNICLKDTLKARILKSNGSYVKVDKRGKELLNSQEYFYKKAVEAFNESIRIEEENYFKPNIII